MPVDGLLSNGLDVVKSMRPMIVGAVASAVLAMLWLFWRPVAREPVAQGKPLSYWTGRLAGAEFSRSYDAIRDIGPAAVPWMLTEVRAAHSPARKVYATVYTKIPAGLRRRLSPPPSPKITDDKVSRVLGLLDRKALPGVLEAFESRHGDVRRVAAMSIGKMILGEEVVGSATSKLAKLLADPDLTVRMAALETLELMESRAEAAVPALIHALQDDSPAATNRVAHRGFRAQSARVLGLIGPAAKAAVPLLTNLVNAPDPDLRAQAAVAWWRITRDTNVAPVLAAELDRAGIHFSQDVVAALGEMGPAAKAAAPVLVRQLKDTNLNPIPFPATFALEALKKIDRAAAAAVEREHQKAEMSAYVMRMLASEPELLRRRARTAFGDTTLPGSTSTPRVERFIPR